MRKKTKNQIKEPLRLPKEDRRLPFIEHVYELRRRLFFVAISITIFSTLGYFVQQQLVHFLLKPSKGQQFIYTTPGGGLNFLFQVCIYFGITLSIPVLIYQALKYIEPLIHHHTRKMMIVFSASSWLLAIGGAAFGYFVGLPIALNFLAHQFTTAQIKPLLTIQEYMSFVIIYLMGSALLFQIPLILMFINRIKPLSPKKLLSYERYLIALAFIAGAIMTPTPDMINQLLFAGPIIIIYQLSIAIIFIRNRRRSYEPVQPHHTHEVEKLANPYLNSSIEVQKKPAPTIKPSPVLQPLPTRLARPIPGVPPPVGRVRIWDIA